MSKKKADPLGDIYDPYQMLARELSKIIFRDFEEKLLRDWDILENDGKLINEEKHE